VVNLLKPTLMVSLSEETLTVIPYVCGVNLERVMLNKMLSRYVVHNNYGSQ
jgi:hypothetical protein